LRAMNMLYEGLRENASLVIVPSTAVESMNLGVIGGLAALKQQIAGNGAAAQNGGGAVAGGSGTKP
jgi:hypothetical protein